MSMPGRAGQQKPGNIGALRQRCGRCHTFSDMRSAGLREATDLTEKWQQQLQDGQSVSPPPVRAQRGDLNHETVVIHCCQ